MNTKSILGFFWRHIKPYKWWYMLMLCAPIFTSFYTFGYNYAIKLFLDAMEKSEQLTYEAVLFPIGLFIFIQLMMDIVWRISNFAEWRSEPFVRRSILIKSYDYVQHHSYTFFQNNFTGAVSSKIKGLLDGYDKFWAEMHHGLFLRIIKIIINLTALSIVSAKLGLFMFIWTLIYAPVIFKFSIRLNQLAHIETDSRHALIGQVSDKISNIISLMSFSARKHELHKLDEQVKTDFIPKQVRLYKYDFMIQLIGGLLYLVMFAFLLFYMLHLKIHSDITIGDFAFVFGISLVVAEDIWESTVSLQEFSRAMGDLRSAMSILNTPQQGQDKSGATALIIKQPTIEFQQVNFGYDSNPLIFSALNLSIKAGEKIGLVGHSGAGKSSLVNLLLRYFQCVEGEILIDGQDTQTVTQDSLREQIAVIPQDTMLFHRSIMENIRYGNPDASDAEVIAVSKKAHLDEFVQSLPEQYDTFVGERGIKLSGGQRQRIAIARAILKQAPILILDEATSSLDSQTEQFIQDSLNYLMENSNATMIAIAHRLSTLKNMDRIIVLDKGKVVEQGTHDTLITQPQSLYKRLWDLQAI